MTEMVVRRARWVAATLVGLGVWVAASAGTAPILGTSLIGPVVGFVPAILVAGRIVGARTVTRWIMISVLTIGLVVAFGAVLLIGFVSSLR